MTDLPTTTPTNELIELLNKLPISLLKLIIKLIFKHYLYPEMAFSNELLPAPDGPMMATSCPDANLPSTPLTTSSRLPGNNKTSC
jgi:hypothetical protein